MEREQVIKALECCDADNPNCGDCPCYDNHDYCWNLNKHALSLIKELTAEIEVFKAERNNYKHWYFQAVKENENLHTSYTELAQKCASLNDENERLKSVEFTCGFIKPHKVLECPIFDEIAKAKADTVRNMQERLKEHLEKPEFPWDSFTVTEEVIDQIAKEMLEGGEKA